MEARCALAGTHAVVVAGPPSAALPSSPPGYNPEAPPVSCARRCSDSNHRHQQKQQKQQQERRQKQQQEQRQQQQERRQARDAVFDVPRAASLPVQQGCQTFAPEPAHGGGTLGSSISGPLQLDATAPACCGTSGGSTSSSGVAPFRDPLDGTMRGGRPRRQGAAFAVCAGGSGGASGGSSSSSWPLHLLDLRSGAAAAAAGVAVGGAAAPSAAATAFCASPRGAASAGDDPKTGMCPLATDAVLAQVVQELRVMRLEMILAAEQRRNSGGTAAEQRRSSK